MRTVKGVSAWGRGGATRAGDDGNLLLESKQLVEGAGRQDLLGPWTDQGQRPGVQDEAGDDSDDGVEHHPSGSGIGESNEPSTEPDSDGRGPEEQNARQAVSD